MRHRIVALTVSIGCRPVDASSTRRPAQAASRGVRQHVHLSSIHRGRSRLHADGGIFLVGAPAYPFLTVLVAAVDLPTITGHDAASGADPVYNGNHRSPRRSSANSRQSPGVRNDLSRVLGVRYGNSAIDLSATSMAAAGDIQAAISNAAGGQLPKNLPSLRTLQKVNPAEPYDPGLCRSFRRVANHGRWRIMREIS